MRYLTLLIFLFPFSMAAQNVGIGTPNPQKKLDVNGSVKIADTLEVEKKLSVGNTEPLSTLHILHDASAGPTQGLRIDNSFDPGQDDNWWNIHTQGSSGDLFFYSGDSPTTASINFVLESDGDVGIGTHNPQERLEVVGNMKVSDGILVESFGGNKHRNVIVDQQGNLEVEMNPIPGPPESQRTNGTQNNFSASLKNGFINADFGAGILGEVQDPGQDDRVEIFEIDHFLFKNSDITTGIPTGQVKNRYFTFYKSNGRSSIPLLSKFKNNEVIDTARFYVYTEGDAGQMINSLTLTLSNCRIQEFNLSFKETEIDKLQLLECFLLSYDSIELEYRYNSEIYNTIINWNF